MSLQLHLQDIISSEVDVPLEDWQPEDPFNVSIQLDLEIGEAGRDGVNLFYLPLATPRALQHKDHYVLLPQRCLVVDYFDFPRIKGHIQQILERCPGDSWEDCCHLLQRYFQWEYEGMC